MTIPYELETANSSDDVLAIAYDKLTTLEKVALSAIVTEYLRQSDEYEVDEVITSVFETLLLPECADYLPKRTAPALSGRFDAIVAFCEINEVEVE